jgi:hypothetical protein
VYRFEIRYPTAEGAWRAVDDAGFHRAVTEYRSWYPTVSVERIFDGNREIGIGDNAALRVVVTHGCHTEPGQRMTRDLREEREEKENALGICQPAATSRTRGQGRRIAFARRRLDGNRSDYSYGDRRSR